MITLNPKIEAVNNAVNFEQINYSQIGMSVDAALFLQYKWGYSVSPPSPVSSVYSLGVFLDYALSQISPEKVNVGVPTLGYDWEICYAPCLGIRGTDQF